MTKKIYLAGLLILSVILSGCTVKTKNGGVYVDTDTVEIETYQNTEKNIQDKDTFASDIEVGNLELKISNDSLYDLTTIIKHHRGDYVKPPEIENLEDTVKFSTVVGNVTGTIADIFKNFDLKLNVGNAKLLLNSGNFKNIDVDINLGNAEIYLPDNGEGTMRLDVSTGAAKIYINKDSGYIIHYSLGIGDIDIHADKILIGEGTYRINPEKDVKYEIWVDVGTGHIEVSK